MICVPIRYGGIFNGVLTFASGEKHNFWHEEAVPLLKILAQVFANALERKHIEENSLTETKRIVPHIGQQYSKNRQCCYSTATFVTVCRRGRFGGGRVIQKRQY